MSEQAALERENLYLKQRLARLQEDVTDLSAEVERLRQRLERAAAPRPPQRPDPLSGGQ